MRLRATPILVLPVMLAGYIYSQALPGAGSRVSPADRPGSIRGNVAMPDGSPVSEAMKVTLKAIRGVAMVFMDQQRRFELGNITPTGCVDVLTRSGWQNNSRVSFVIKHNAHL